MYTIYCHENKTNHKKYVGITCQQPWTKRFNGDGLGYKQCVLFYKAILKYGWDNFTHTVLTTCETEQEANILEKYYIDLYKSNNKEHGYNIKTGGDHQKYPKEICQKISEAKKGKAPRGAGWNHTEETKEKISNAQKGRPLSPEHAENCRKATREYYKTHSPAHEFTKEDYQRAQEASKKKVCIVETGQVFSSMTECANYLDVLVSNLSRAIRFNKQYKGFHYKIVYS